MPSPKATPKAKVEEPDMAPEEEVGEIVNKLEIWTLDRRIEQVKMLLYGDSGVGKTRFASTAPNPVFLDADNGMMSVQVPVGRWPCEEWEDLQVCWEMLANEDHGFDTVVLDGMNRIQTLSMEYVIRTFQARRNYGSQPTQPDWGKALSDQERMIRSYLSLPMHVIVICHPKPRDSEADRLRPMLSGKQTASMIERYMDLVAYMYVQQGDTDKPKRMMAFDVTWAVSKSRLKDALPATVEDPTWDRLEQFWSPPKRGKKK